MMTPEVGQALRGLEQAIVPPRPGASLGNWRFAVRQRLGVVRDALATADLPLDSRERSALIARVMGLSADVLDRPDVEAVRGELRRLVIDVGQQAARA
jgi:hypothetical protein